MLIQLEVEKGVSSVTAVVVEVVAVVGLRPVVAVVDFVVVVVSLVLAPEPVAVAG